MSDELVAQELRDAFLSAQFFDLMFWVVEGDGELQLPPGLESEKLCFFSSREIATTRRKRVVYVTGNPDDWRQLSSVVSRAGEYWQRTARKVAADMGQPEDVWLHALADAIPRFERASWAGQWVMGTKELEKLKAWAPAPERMREFSPERWYAKKPLVNCCLALLPHKGGNPLPDAAPGEGEKLAGRTRGVPLAEAEIRVREWLKKHAPGNPAAITRDAVAKGTGVSPATVSRTCAWKAFRERRDAEKQPPRPRERSLSGRMLAAVPSNTKRPDELAALVEEQQQELAEEELRHKRRSEKRSGPF